MVVSWIYCLLGLCASVAKRASLEQRQQKPMRKREERSDAEQLLALQKFAIRSEDGNIVPLVSSSMGYSFYVGPLYESSFVLAVSVQTKPFPSHLCCRSISGPISRAVTQRQVLATCPPPLLPLRRFNAVSHSLAVSYPATTLIKSLSTFQSRNNPKAKQ